MKRFALLSVFSLLLASAVFAPVAVAQELGEVDVQSVRLGPGGSVTVTGTIECVEGYYYSSQVDVRQKTGGNVYNTVSLYTSGQCGTNGPTAFTASGFGEKPFHKGPATVQPHSTLYPPDFSTNINWTGDIEATRVR